MAQPWAFTARLRGMPRPLAAVDRGGCAGHSVLEGDILTDCAVTCVPFLEGQPRAHGTASLAWAACWGCATMAGNEVCFQPNWLGLELSYEQCCAGDILTGPDCFRPLGGFYTRSFCCYEPEAAEVCDWHEVLQAVATSEQVDHQTFTRVAAFPMMLREFCCIVPGDGSHPCWHAFGEDENAVLPAPYVQCCFPVLRRLLGSDPIWAEELQEEFASLGSRRWTSQQLLSFQASAEQKPCLLSIRGSEVWHHGLDACCPQDLPGNDCSYIHAVAQALHIVGTLKPLPDLDLLLSPSNQDRYTAPVPVFTRHRPRRRSGLLLLPVEWQLSPGQSRKHATAAQRHGARSEWKWRRKGLFWRGTNSNCFMSCDLGQVASGGQSWDDCLRSYDCARPWSLANFLHTVRGRLVFMSQFLENLDAKWVGTANPMEEELWSFFEESGLTSARVSEREAQAEWSYAINVDGTGSGDRIYWQLLTGSVVLVQDSPWASWPRSLGNFSRLIQPDLSDLVRQLQWLQDHDSEAEELALRGERWAREFLSFDFVLLFLHEAMRRYAGHFDPSSLLAVAPSAAEKSATVVSIWPWATHLTAGSRAPGPRKPQRARSLPGTAHEGFVKTAEKLLQEIEERLREEMESHPGYHLVFCGHSMGGAVSAMCAAILRDKASLQTHAWARECRAMTIGTPASMSRNLGERLAAESAVYTVVNGQDWSPRASLSIGKELLDDLCELSVARTVVRLATGAAFRLKDEEPAEVEQLPPGRILQIVPGKDDTHLLKAQVTDYRHSFPAWPDVASHIPLAYVEGLASGLARAARCDLAMPHRAARAFPALQRLAAEADAAPPSFEAKARLPAYPDQAREVLREHLEDLCSEQVLPL
ncbi:unnamed protein product [Effrenium voratum]|uniref:Glycosyl transferase CAP10 domain-containing protein n=1 Tax=Effrenium voratum TaxID=2562239 RepID=A0AA36ITT0_9DINO|nr:unnamed protein product [Effrenium voratum]